MLLAYWPEIVTVCVCVCMCVCNQYVGIVTCAHVLIIYIINNLNVLILLECILWILGPLRRK